MSKFQAEYSIANQSFEDFILAIYVLVDDLYKKVAPNQVKCRRNLLEVTNLIFTQLARQLSKRLFRN